MGFYLNSRPVRFVRPPRAGWDPRTWATRIPFRKLDNFWEVFRAAWENRDNLRYAWRILNEGVCDGCALGTTGLTDWTIDGVHLCNVRLRLLRLNTLRGLDPALLADISRLRDSRARDLRALGRLPVPLIRRRGEAGFRPIDWDAALNLIAERISASGADRAYFYLTSRGIPNETYYAAQKAVRAIGTNNLDNAARICHSPSTFGLKSALGVGATTCSYSDLIGTDLVTFFGSNVAINQPVMMKYLYHAKKAGTVIASVNAFREPAMERYWIPSETESALFGTRFTDHFFQVRAGADIAFLNGAAKHLIAQGWHDARFVAEHTRGFEALRAHLESLSWETLEAQAGVTTAQMQDYAALLAKAERAVFVWGMGITQHACGEDNVTALINLALLKGFVGREGCGLMPIRGHSGVQGGAEMGAYATAFPGGLPIDEEHAADLSARYGFPVPSRPGLTTPEMLAAAEAGQMDVLFAVGGNFREVLPDPDRVSAALERIPLRVHMDITLSSQMFIDPADTVLLLPAMTRYEIPGGVTETSTERRVIFSPEVTGPRIAQARPEWDVLGDLAARVRPQWRNRVHFASTAAIRAEIAQVVPFYAGIEKLRAAGDQFQYGGPHLCEGWTFPTPDGRAHFAVPSAPQPIAAAGDFILVTRRGKQFNSMVHEDTEGATGFGRDSALMSAADAARLGLSEGERIDLVNERGRYTARLRVAEVAEGTLHVYWPEANGLLHLDARSPLAQVPAYKSGAVRVERSVQDSQPAVRV